VAGVRKCQSLLAQKNQGGYPEGSRSPYAVHFGLYSDRALVFCERWPDGARGSARVPDLDAAPPSFPPLEFLLPSFAPLSKGDAKAATRKYSQPLQGIVTGPGRPLRSPEFVVGLDM